MNMNERPAISKHNGAWSNAALVVDAIADGGAAKLALACYGFQCDEQWARAMKAELEALLRPAAEFRKALEEVKSIAEDRMDITDGPEGRQLPNEWMKLATFVRVVLATHE